MMESSVAQALRRKRWIEHFQRKKRNEHVCSKKRIEHLFSSTRSISALRTANPMDGSADSSTPGLLAVVVHTSVRMDAMFCSEKKETSMSMAIIWSSFDLAA